MGFEPILWQNLILTFYSILEWNVKNDDIQLKISFNCSSTRVLTLCINFYYTWKSFCFLLATKALSQVACRPRSRLDVVHYKHIIKSKLWALGTRLHVPSHELSLVQSTSTVLERGQELKWWHKWARLESTGTTGSILLVSYSVLVLNESLKVENSVGREQATGQKHVVLSPSRAL